MHDLNYGGNNILKLEQQCYVALFTFQPQQITVQAIDSQTLTADGQQYVIHYVVPDGNTALAGDAVPVSSVDVSMVETEVVSEVDMTSVE